jgi:HAD superfamily hydrolase (TIGR01490 family)
LGGGYLSQIKFPLGQTAERSGRATDPAGESAVSDTLAIFDLDDTLLAADSGTLWGEYLAEQGLLEGTAFRLANERFDLQYRAGTLDIAEFLRFSLSPLVDLARDRFLSLRRDFVDTRIRQAIAPGTHDLLDFHRGRGDTLMVITATHRPLTEPIAELLAIDVLLASEADLADGRPTGDIRGIPCYREGKVTRLEQWIAATGSRPDRIWFYSDSANDLPLLEHATDPVAVDPDPNLRREATRRGWPVITLRGDQTDRY